MTNLRDFFNSVSGNNRIFTCEDIGEMSQKEFAHNEIVLPACAITDCFAPSAIAPVATAVI